MHRCLYISEIVRHIADCISPLCLDPLLRHEPVVTDLKSVARLAITCRAFTEPALDRLWYQLPSLWPLFMLFPQDSWDVRFETRRRSPIQIYSIFVFIRRLRPEDWSRFTFYARRVRSTSTHEEWSDYRISPSAMSLVGLQQVTEKILPRLHTLRWTASEKLMPHMDLFLSAELKYLLIEYPEHYIETEELATALSALPALCPNIIALDAVTWSPDLLSELVVPQNGESVGKLASLTSLAVFGNISSDTLSYLSTWDQLESLYVGRILWRSFAARYSKSLRSLETRVWYFSAKAYDFFESFRPLNISRFSLVVEDNKPLKPNISRLFQDVSFFSRLTDLAIKIRPDRPNSRDDIGKMSLEDLKPILAFRHLRDLEILIESLHFDDSDIATLASRFPALRYLALIPLLPDGRQWPCQITEAGLRSLAEHCPRLRYLDANIVIQPEADAQRSMGQPIPENFKLRYIHVGSSPVSDVAGTAAVLTKYFPNLSSIKTYDTNTANEKWDEVRQLVADF